jgi:hypothetical protein
MPPDRLIFGVDSFMQKEETERFVSLIKIPFGKYRKPKATDHKPIL